MTAPPHKILINCLSARSGGAISYLRNAIGSILAEGNRLDGVEIHALCDARQALQIDTSPDRRILAETDRLGGWKRSLWERRNLPRIVRQGGYGTVFTPYQLSAAALPVRSVLMLRNMEPFFFERYHYSFKNRLRNQLLRRSTIRSTRAASHVIAVSEFARDYLIDVVGVSRHAVTRIYHGRDPFFSEPVDDDEARRLLEELQVESPFLLTCGSLLPYRRCEDVIDAFGRFSRPEDRSFQLVVAGDGNDPPYKTMLQQRSNQPTLAGRIRFTGHVSPQHMRALYQQAKLVVLATEIEACPNIAIESMSAGAAILASDSPPLPEIIGRENASFFERRNTVQLADRIGHLLNSPAEAAELQQRARRRADDYGWQTCTAKTLQLLTQLPIHG